MEKAGKNRPGEPSRASQGAVWSIDKNCLLGGPQCGDREGGAFKNGGELNLRRGLLVLAVKNQIPQASVGDVVRHA